MTSQPAFIADCGHLVIPTSNSCGYGNTIANTRICYACCALQDEADMRKHERIVLYVTSQAYSENGFARRAYFITNWPGSLKIKAYNVRTSKGYGFGRQYDIVTGRFTFEGKPWSFRNAGDNQIARCLALKGRVATRGVQS